MNLALQQLPGVHLDHSHRLGHVPLDRNQLNQVDQKRLASLFKYLKRSLYSRERTLLLHLMVVHHHLLMLMVRRMLTGHHHLLLVLLLLLLMLMLLLRRHSHVLLRPTTISTTGAVVAVFAPTSTAHRRSHVVRTGRLRVPGGR